MSKKDFVFILTALTLCASVLGLTVSLLKNEELNRLNIELNGENAHLTWLLKKQVDPNTTNFEIYNNVFKNGLAGSVVFLGKGAPNDGIGKDGDGYLDMVTDCLYGPKEAGAWPHSCKSYPVRPRNQGPIGPKDQTGPTGPTGRPGARSLEEYLEEGTAPKGSRGFGPVKVSARTR